MNVRTGSKHKHQNKNADNQDYANSKQLAEIQTLLKKEQQFRIRKFSPITAAISMLIPTLASHLLLGKGKLLNDQYEIMQSFFANEAYSVFADLYDQLVRLNQKIIEAVDERIDALKMIPSLYGVDISKESKVDIILFVATNLDEVANQELQNQVYKSFLLMSDLLDSALNSVHKVLSMSPGTDLDINSAVGNIELTNSNYTPFKFYQLGKRVLQKYETLKLLHNHKEINLYSISRIQFASIIFGVARAAKVMLLNFIGLSVVAKNFVVDPTFSFVYGKLQTPYSLHKINLITLSSDQAYLYIQELQLANKTLEVQAKRSVWFMRIFTLISLLLAAEAVNVKREIEPAVLVFILTNLATIINDLINSSYEYYKQYALTKRLQVILQQNNKIIAGLKKTWEMDRSGEFLIFNGCHFQQLSPYVVNQTLKNILLKNGIEIVSYSHNTLTIAATKLTDKKANLINKQLSDYLTTLLAIKKMTMQIAQLFPLVNFVKFITLASDGLPTAKFVLPATNLVYKLATFQNLFSQCLIIINDDVVTIEGRYPATPQALQCVLGEFKATNLSSTSLNFSRAYQQPTHVKHRSLWKESKPEQPKATVQVSQQPTPRMLKIWASATYDSEAEQCEVKQLSHRLLGRNHFILFRLPQHCFPSPAVYSAVKKKIEEADLAESKVGAQGLQFRVEFAKDETQPNRPWFRAEMRGKFLGNHLGDIRVYASKETNAAGDHLFIFKGINLNAH
jgi:hypothetical protein